MQLPNQPPSSLVRHCDLATPPDSPLPPSERSLAPPVHAQALGPIPLRRRAVAVKRHPAVHDMLAATEQPGSPAGKMFGSVTRHHEQPNHSCDGGDHGGSRELLGHWAVLREERWTKQRAALGAPRLLLQARCCTRSSKERLACLQRCWRAPVRGFRGLHGGCGVLSGRRCMQHLGTVRGGLHGCCGSQAWARPRSARSQRHAGTRGAAVHRPPTQQHTRADATLSEVAAAASPRNGVWGAAGRTSRGAALHHSSWITW